MPLTPEQRHLRLLEIVPLKNAMMAAQRRNVRRESPLCIMPGLEPWPELQVALDQITIEDPHVVPEPRQQAQPNLDDLTRSFFAACDGATKAWMRQYFALAATGAPVAIQTVWSTLEGTAYAGLQTSVNETYVKLSRHLEKLLA
jgi:hypothetical protein